MNNHSGGLGFDAYISKEKFDEAIAEIKREIQGVADTTNAETDKMSQGFNRLGAQIAAMTSIAALSGLARQIINVRGEFQKLEISFETMLGSKAKADALMAEVVELAAITPFSLQQVAGGAKQLLAYQVPAEQVIDTLRRLGDISAGLGVPLERLQLIYGQVLAKGRLFTEEMRQFTEAGVPMLAMLAKSFEVTNAEMSEMVSAGKIGFEDVKNVLFGMTDAGGMFYNLMEKQSASLSGQVSNLADAYETMLNDIGQANEGIFNDAISSAAYLVENYKDVLEILESLVVGYGLYRTALIFTSVAQGGMVTPALIQGMSNLVKLIRGATVAQAALNATTMANPYIAAAAAISTLASAVYYFATRTTDATEAQKQMTAETERNSKIAEKVSEAMKSTYAEQIDSVRNLIRVLKSEHTSMKMRKEAYEQLVRVNSAFVGTVDDEYRAIASLDSVYKRYVQNIKDVALAKGRADYLSDLGKRQAETEIEIYQASEKRKTEIKRNEERKRIADSKNAAAKIAAEQYGDKFDRLGAGMSYDRAAKQETTALNELNKAKTEYYLLQGQINAMTDINTQQVEKLNKAITTGMENGIKLTKEDIDAKKQQLDILLGIEKQNEKVASPLEDKKPKTAKEKAEEIFPEGSIAEIEKRLQAVNALIEKTPISDAEKIQQYVDRRVELEEQLADARKKIAVQSEQEMIRELMRKWELYYSYISAFGKEQADLLFPDIASSGADNMTEFLEGQLSALQKLHEPTEEQISLMITLKEKMDELAGIGNPLEEFTKGLREQSKTMNSMQFIEYLERLRNSLMGIAGSESKLQAVEDALESEREAFDNHYKQLIDSVKTNEEILREIQEQERDALQYAESKQGTPGFDYENEVNKIREYFSRMRSEVNRQLIESSNDWKVIFEGLEKHSHKSVRKAIENIRVMMEKLDMPEADKAKIMKELAAVERQMETTFTRLVERFKNFQDADQADKLEFFGKLMQTGAEAVGEAGDSILSIMDSLGMESTEIVAQVIGDVQNIAQGAADIAQGIATGDPLQVLKGIGSVVKTVSDWISGDRKRERSIKRHQQAVERLSTAYRQLQYDIQNALGTEYFSLQNQSIQNIRQQMETIRQMREQERKKKKTDSGAMSQYNQQLQDLENEIDSIMNSITEEIVQTSAVSLADELGSALESAWSRGEDASIAYGEIANNVLKNAIRNALQMEFLEVPLQQAIERLRNAMGYNEDGSGDFDGLSEQEIENFRNAVAQMSANFNAAMAEYSDLFTFDPSSGGSAMEGAIRGVSQETAGLIEGQMNAIRINQAENLQVNRNLYALGNTAITHLAQIRDYTATLVDIRRDINDIRNRYLV